MNSLIKSKQVGISFANQPENIIANEVLQEDSIESLKDSTWKKIAHEK